MLFKVGQEVWCLMNGRGVVSDIFPERVFCVCVKFDNKRTASYTVEGKYANVIENRCLYFSEPVVTGLTEPPFEAILKNGDKLLVTYSNGHARFLTVDYETQYEIFFIGHAYGDKKREIKSLYRVDTNELEGVLNV